MRNPKIEKRYLFVRSNGGVIEPATFIRSSDGSAVIFYAELTQVHENQSDAWRHALAELDEFGFVELREAKSSGLIPEDWEPASATHAAVGAELAPNYAFKRTAERDFDVS